MSPLRETVAIEALALDQRYRCLRDLPGVRLDLRYASPRNLLGRDLYSPHDCAWLSTLAAHSLERASQVLSARRPDLQLLVLDAARPQRVQELFWSHVRGTPMQPYFADPARGSLHSYGMAVDLTLAGPDGRELDMGTGFDDTTPHSHPALESALLEQGVLQADQVANRQLLRDVMLQCGWRGIATEWWHFNHGDESTIRSRWPLIV